ncbi:hypothetical protein [Pedobacter sp. L105]|uniref:hypothetical protein n=1 Tax=Pedobacter sp. L105 TaxID=1641871 RepID=UPI00131BEAAC|nr:hypothetical protein [Pedobacter sp. L105]
MLEIDIKSNLLNRQRKLIINAELIEFDDTNWRHTPATQFSRREVEAIRFGIKPIRGYSFIIGRKYCIDIKGLDDRVIKIRLVSLYGIRRKSLDEKFNQILQAFFDTHQKDIVNYYLEIFHSQIEINILGTSFRQSGVVLNGKEVAWNDLGHKAYYSYYALYAKSEPTNYRSYNYLNDWNTAVVYSFSRQILADKGLLD